MQHDASEPVGAAALAAAAACLLALGIVFLAFRPAWLAWAALPIFIALLDRRAPRGGFALGFAAGFAGLMLAFAWLVDTLRVFGGFGVVLAIALAVVPVLWMALQFGLFGALVPLLAHVPAALGPPLAWTTVELLFPSPFPWRLAHTQYRVPLLLQTGDLAGPYLLGFAMIWAAAGLTAAWRRLRDGRGAARAVGVLAAPAALLVAIAAYGAWRLEGVRAARAAAPPLRVGVIQGNVGVERKGDRSFFRRNLDDYRALSRSVALDVDLLIWPETVVQDHLPAELAHLPPSRHPFPDLPRPLLFGGLALERSDGVRRVYNSAFLAVPGGDVIGRYDKRILVPFGEYMPFGDAFPSLRKLSPATGSFAVGTTPPVLTLDGAARISPLVCYEDVVPGPTRLAVAEGATLLVNLTNDAWYGRSAEPLQHQALALWRAVEVRRDLVRATNTGLTSVIAATGEVLGELPLFTAEPLVREVRLLEIRTLYGRVGDVFAWSVVAVAALGLATRRRWTARS